MFKNLSESTTQARLHDLAKAEAIRLRREAIEAVWHGGNSAREAKLDPTNDGASEANVAKHHPPTGASHDCTS
jgi:hypothetical protein